MNNDPLTHETQTREAQSSAVASGVFKGLFGFFILLPLAVIIVTGIVFGLYEHFSAGGSDYEHQEALRARLQAQDAKQAKIQAKQDAEQAKAQAQAKARQDAAKAAALEQAAQDLWTQRQWALKDGSAVIGTLSSIKPDKVLILVANPPASRFILRSDLVESDQQLVTIAAAKQEKP